MSDLKDLINEIIAINHAWKLSKDRFGDAFPATKSLRDSKSLMQAHLLRDFPNDSFLKVATDNNEHADELFSVRLKTPIKIGNLTRSDAEHLPVRIAKEIFLQHELEKFLTR
ncbi:hypothetical protein [Paraferrimonas sp. SM1919]|uniref:hypothetical protein n=1 Tax=Paraferrimonas sp. SM1919 TaxID=2662263 RepID=UPI0013D5C616|nr:hypothetical protein [Paraferrimonas sp. SM1919]